MRVRSLVFVVFLCVPAIALHATTIKNPSFEVAGWVPYWRGELGTANVLAHVEALTTVHPFGYSVQDDGTLIDEMGVTRDPWKSFNLAIRTANVRLIPTIIWHDGQAIHTVLRDPVKRKAHINNIVRVVERGGFDGIDIDYEAKLADTNPYFTLFLKELYIAMGKHWVYCTIEPRTPPASVFSVVPRNLQYANDYAALRTYCDRVVIMAYDQGSIDFKLTKAAQGKPYMPVADVAWVEKVLMLAAESIPKHKLIIGIPTYGYEYTVTPRIEGFRYDRLGAFNPQYAVDLAHKLGATPTRNSAGEISFSYIATSAPLFTSTGIAAGPSFSANAAVYNVLWWSDATAVQQKIELAKKLGVRGVSIFKLDGSQDPKIWDILLGY